MVVEDDASVAKGLLHGLRQEGFHVAHAKTGESALHMAEDKLPHIVLLDIRLPDINGFDVCRIYRERRFTMPVIMVTARDEEIDRILGLEIGADDYLVKPFSFRELVSRIRAQLRRAYGSFNLRSENTLACGDIVIDRRRVTVQKRNRQINLTPIEYKLLLFLAENKDVPIARDRIIDSVWGHNFFGDERTVDVHIRHLREKLEDNPAEPVLINTVRGFGYRLSLRDHDMPSALWSGGR